MRTLFLLLASLPLACARVEAHGPRPSFVFVSIDTLSARHMSLYGYGRPTTPRIDQLAESAVVFERCWANAPWTTPSYMSQFTGLHAASFRKPGPTSGGESPWAFADAHTTLAEMLRERGYRTAAFVDNHNVGAHLGFDQGFEVFDDSAAHISIDEPSGGIDHVVPRALAWLDGLGGDEPFFLFVQVLDVHGPYLSAGPFARAFEDAPSTIAARRVPVALEGGLVLGAIPRYIAEPHLDDETTELDVRPLVDDYDEGILAIDAAIAGFHDELAARGVPDRAYFLLSADHGESMVEHDSYFNHQLLHAQDLHVPLLVRPPGGCAPLRVNEDVQLLDLYPTFAEWSGAALPRPGHGRSLVRAIAGDRLPPRPHFAACEFLASSSVVSDGWKLVETNPSLANSGVVGFLGSPRARAWIARRFPEFEGRVFGTSTMPPSVLDGVDVDALWREAQHDLAGPFHALYDLANDPEECEDVAALHGERVRALRALLDDANARAREAYVPAEPGATPLDDAQREELARLGYAGSGE